MATFSRKLDQDWNDQDGLPPEPITMWPLFTQWASLDAMAAGCEERERTGPRACA